jgi:hypothetical protein
MVKRLRLQSALAPRRRCCSTMAPPLSAFQEFLAAQAHAAHLPLGQLALDDQLGGDAGMVGARLPQHVTPTHALEAGENVLQRVVEGMADMQAAGDIGRRNDDGKRLRAGAAAGLEGAGGFPLGIDAPFHIRRVESLVEHAESANSGRGIAASWPFGQVRRLAIRCAALL